ncbi:hypothetical protein ACFE04_015712 [Oxalis oulophora]
MALALAAIIAKFFVMLLLLNVLAKGYGHKHKSTCSLKDIHINQRKTIKTLTTKGHHTVWEVIISNTCECSQMYIRLECQGFRSGEIINRSKLVKTGRTCLVNDGFPINGHKTFSFRYVSARPYPFQPISSTLAC